LNKKNKIKNIKRLAMSIIHAVQLKQAVNKKMLPKHAVDNHGGGGGTAKSNHKIDSSQIAAEEHREAARILHRVKRKLLLRVAAARDQTFLH